MAEGIVDSFAAEEPGTQLLALPCDAALAVSGVGRLVAALAQCGHFFNDYQSVDEALSRARGTEILELITILGLIQGSPETADVIYAPRALFVRIARLLEGTADLVSDDALEAALRSDVLIAKAGSETYRL
jgi:hypothetical protein